MPKVLVTDPLNDIGLKILQDIAEVNYSPGLSKEEIIKIIGEYDALLVRSGTFVGKEIIDSCSPTMKIIGRAGVGVDNIELEAATQKGIVVVNSPDGNTTAAAEHTVAMMMSLTRLIPAANESMKHKEWKRKNFMGVEMRNKVLGVVGLGKIGSKVVQVAQALGMKVLGYDPVISASRAANMNIELVELERIWKDSDFITLHVPKVEQTVNLICKETIAQMKPEVRIINCARGGIVNEKDIVDAIKEKRIAGAALDVFDNEPLEKESPLYELISEGCNNLILTPHLGASTEEAQLNVAIDVAEQIKEVLSGGFARSAVNLPSFRGIALDEFESHLKLSEFLGKLLDQFSGSARPLELNVQFKGDLTKKETTPLVLAATKGFLAKKIEGVSFVNAKLIAEEKGIKVVESKSSDKSDYAEEMVLELKTDKGNFQVAGTLHNDKFPMITSLNHYSFFVAPSSHMLLTLHDDKPGVIAKVSKLLGDNDINISGMALGRKGVREEALMLCNLDEALSKENLAKIKEVGEVQKAAYISL
ncbi:MAG: phosphoglycerate dehydrogenase [Candidatus Caenarcaniphilales bacterium]|nr:phosphoglycerate dehydrogenase [Candidatus Caenarcaniphilales bacterium]